MNSYTHFQNKDFSSGRNQLSGVVQFLFPVSPFLLDSSAARLDIYVPPTGPPLSWSPFDPAATKSRAQPNAAEAWP